VARARLLVAPNIAEHYGRIVKITGEACSGRQGANQLCSLGISAKPPIWRIVPGAL
jgi:hypothetical protein